MQEKIQEREGGELDYRDIYTPLSVAKEEIWRRWNDKELRKKVDDFLEEKCIIGKKINKGAVL